MTYVWNFTVLTLILFYNYYSYVMAIWSNGIVIIYDIEQNWNGPTHLDIKEQAYTSYHILVPAMF
jgi:hypothetical protein